MLRPILLLLFLSLCVPVLADEPRVIQVSLDSYSFKPNKITAKVGESILLKVKNEATFIPHNIVIKAPQAGIDIKINVGAGKTGEAHFTPTQAGSYEFICDKEPPIGKSHKVKGMHGTLIVE